ncbi:MAG: hypothetical protein KatS3mg031_2707 [Chitinophagales bacterium]|nr:MAG: hypothetical protein KatS3mg031_2707 [Chitinophagales bacterium]
MHTIEPFYNWRKYYIASEDERSPFYRQGVFSSMQPKQIYNFIIHPEWDDIGSSTLYVKVLYVSYRESFAVIELMGEWNDCIHNDIMYLKRNLIDGMVKNGIYRYILVGENVLNFHCSDDCYYEEWLEDVMEEGGWIAAINFRQHVLDEMKLGKLHHYINFGGGLNNLLWRKLPPLVLLRVVDEMIIKALR